MNPKLVYRPAALPTSPKTLLRNASVRQKKRQLVNITAKTEVLEAKNAAMKIEHATKIKAIKAKTEELQKIHKAMKSVCNM